VIETTHKFTDNENDWGFTQFMRLSDVLNPLKGYLKNDTLIIRAGNILHLETTLIIFHRHQSVANEFSTIEEFQRKLGVSLHLLCYEFVFFNYQI
jgi:hypothetical protein